MKIARMVFALTLPGILCGFTSGHAVLNAKSTPDTRSAYVGGMFSRIGQGSFTFVLRNEKTGKQYDFPLFPASGKKRGLRNHVSAIRLPAGTYAVTAWRTTAGGGITRNNAMTLPRLRTPFVVKANTVMFLGDFLMRGPLRLGTKTAPDRGVLRSGLLDVAGARKAFLAEFPGFGSSAVQCLLCFDSRVGRSDPCEDGKGADCLVSTSDARKVMSLVKHKEMPRSQQRDWVGHFMETKQWLTDHRHLVVALIEFRSAHGDDDFGASMHPTYLVALKAGRHPLHIVAMAKMKTGFGTRATVSLRTKKYIDCGGTDCRAGIPLKGDETLFALHEDGWAQGDDFQSIDMYALAGSSLRRVFDAQVLDDPSGADPSLPVTTTIIHPQTQPHRYTTMLLDSKTKKGQAVSTVKTTMTYVGHEYRKAK